MSDIPPLPAGFTLDSGPPPLPPGFTLDQPHQEAPGFLGGLEAAGELALSGATHAVSGPIAEGLAGLAARATGHDPEGWKAAAEKYAVYNTPNRSVARAYTDAMTRAVAPLVAPVENAVSGDVHTADDFIGKYGGPEAQRIARQAVGTAGDILNAAPLLGAGARAVSTIADAARPIEEAAAVARTPDELARASDIRVPPSIMAATTGAAKPGIAQRAGEALGGSSEMTREDIIHNKGRWNALSAQAANLPEDTLLSHAALDKADAPHAAVYRAVEQAIPELIPIDEATKAKIAAAGERPNSLRPIPATVERAREGALGIDQANGAQLKATIADYRDKGYAALRSDDVDQQAFGKAQLDIANALEDQMERQLDTTNPGLADQFRQARQGFAINNTIREALVGHDVDPKVILKLADSNRGISGELKLIADLTERFPQVATIKVPKRISGGSLLSHGIRSGIGAALGTGAGAMVGFPHVGAVAGLAAAQGASKGIRSIMDWARAGAGDSNVTLGSALADYVRQQGSPFHPSQQIPQQESRQWMERALAERMAESHGRVEVPRTSRDVTLVPGRDYSPPIPPRGSHTPLTNEGLNPTDRALADAIAARNHPSAARVRRPTLFLPAPGASSARAAVPKVNSAVSKQHPANPNVSSTVTQRAQQEKIDHMVQVLAARRAHRRAYEGG